MECIRAERHPMQACGAALVRNRYFCVLHTFGCIEWGSVPCRGFMQARCYSFNIPKHRFHNMNIQVYCTRLILCLSHTYLWFIPLLQDTVLTVPQCPCVLEDQVDVPLEEWSVACPQVFITCHLRPTDGLQPKARHTYGEDDIRVALVQHL